MSDLLFPPPPLPVVPVVGGAGAYAVARIFCVGRNYAAHAAEMGNEVARDAPWFFTKSPTNARPGGSDLPYPPGTAELHHEVELVVAVGDTVHRATSEDAARAIFGYGVGLDMTRRDLQAVAKERRLPWDTAKDLEGGAILGPLAPAGDFAPGPQAITLAVNGAVRQAGQLDQMVWTVPEILAHLSGLYRLGPGDLVMTGTPSGVGPVVPGDRLTGRIAGLPDVILSIAAEA